MNSLKIEIVILILLNIAHSVFAQSGRAIPPTPTPTPTPEVVKPTEVKKEYPPCEANLEEYIYISPKKVVEFGNELNRYGNCGYRLEKSNKIPLKREISEWQTYFFAVMKLDTPNRYEYQWFEAYSPGEVQNRMNIRAKQGFYFKASHPFQIIAENAEDSPSDSVTNHLRSTYGTFLIFERKDNEIVNREYRILDSDGIGKKMKSEHQSKFNYYLGKGFHPVGFVKLSVYFAIVMEKNGQSESNIDYKFLHYNFSLTKKLGELSKTGYEPNLLIPYAALLKKDSNSTNSPKSFILIENPSKIPENPSLLKDKYYLKSSLFYVDDYDLKTSLLFAESQESKNRYEYKIYKMTKVLESPKKMVNYDTLREPPTAEMPAEFQNLLKQGYVVREILASKEIYILLERAKP
jgi:hypothetical protein